LIRRSSPRLTSWGGTTYAWASPVITGLSAAALALTVAWLVSAHHAADPVIPLGAATSSVNFARQIGSSIGVALIGALFVHRLGGQLAAHLPASAAGHLSAHQVGSITPPGLAHLPAPLRHVIAAAFASALPPLYAYLIPLLAVAFLLALLLKEIPLRARAGPDAPQASPFPAGARRRPPRRRLHLPGSHMRPELPAGR
jgi:hypothetical protein